MNSCGQFIVKMIESMLRVVVVVLIHKILTCQARIETRPLKNVDEAEPIIITNTNKSLLTPTLLTAAKNGTTKFRWWPYGFGYIYQTLCADGSIPAGCCYNNYCYTAGYTCQYPGYCCLTTTTVITATTSGTCPTGVTTTTPCSNGVCATGSVCVSTLNANNVCCPATFTLVCADNSLGLGPCINNGCATGYTCINTVCCRTTTTAVTNLICPSGVTAAGACINNQCGAPFVCNVATQQCCPATGR